MILCFGCFWATIKLSRLHNTYASIFFQKRPRNKNALALQLQDTQRAVISIGSSIKFIMEYEQKLLFVYGKMEKNIVVLWWFFLDPKIDLDSKFRHVACLIFLSSKKTCYRTTIKHAKLIFLKFALKQSTLCKLSKTRDAKSAHIEKFLKCQMFTTLLQFL